MTMPFISNQQSCVPLLVIEDNDNYLVHIDPDDRGRAEKIAGREWDGQREVWVYPKNTETYEALVAEFQKDADLFEISPPPKKILWMKNRFLNMIHTIWLTILYIVTSQSALGS